jgi:GTP cyclohydrolase II
MDQAPADGTLRLRAVHRAISDLRRGVPVVLRGATPRVVLSAETAGTAGLVEMAALGDGYPVLVLPSVRAAAVTGRPAGAEEVEAFRLSEQALNPLSLRSLADPTAEQLLSPVQPVDLPPGALSAVALAKLARLLPAVVTVQARAEAAGVVEDRRILCVSEADVLAYPAASAAGLRRVADAVVPLEDAPESRIVAFRSPDAGIEHLAIVIGHPEEQAAPLVRVHSECFTGDLLGSLRCDCGPQLRGAIRRMVSEKAGVLLYLAQEGRGIGLVNKLRAYALQDQGLDTVDANQALGWGADERSFLVAATMLEQLGIHSVRLLTNNLDKLTALAACGVNVVGRVPHVIEPNGVNDFYLATKAARFGHLME